MPTLPIEPGALLISARGRKYCILHYEQETPFSYGFVWCAVIIKGVPQEPVWKLFGETLATRTIFPNVFAPSEYEHLLDKGDLAP